MRTLVIIDRLAGRREGHRGLWSLLIAWRGEGSQRTLVIIDRLAWRRDGSQRTLVIIDRLAGRGEGSQRTLFCHDKIFLIRLSNNVIFF